MRLFGFLRRGRNETTENKDKKRCTYDNVRRELLEVSDEMMKLAAKIWEVMDCIPEDNLYYTDLDGIREDLDARADRLKEIVERIKCWCCE
jgi:hypothetical protein